MKIIDKIKQCDTMPKLDDLRLEVTESMKSDNGKYFEYIQKEFIKQQNKLRRVPLKDRIGW